MWQKLTPFKTLTEMEQSPTSSQRLLGAVTNFSTDSSKKGKEQQTPHHDSHHPDEETAPEENDTRRNTQTAHDSSSTAFCTYIIVTLKLPKSNTVFISLGANNINVKPK